MTVVSKYETINMTIESVTTTSDRDMSLHTWTVVIHVAMKKFFATTL